MRAAVAVSLFLALAAPAAAVEAAGTLALRAPGATTFGHTVDFSGRLSPAKPGARVTLMRGSSLVAATAIRRDGSYRFHVSLGRPGPFHTVAAGISSGPVTVRIVPALRARLVGSRVAGEPLSVVARVVPHTAGSLRVRVVREGKESYRGSFTGHARVKLGTTSLAAFSVAVDTLPAKGYGYVGRQIPVALRAPTVGYGYQGPVVAALLERLRNLGYAAPSPRSVFDSDAQQAVYAFQKAQRLERTGVADATFWKRLAEPAEIAPRYKGPADHIEIDKQRQILMLVRDGRVALISPVSTAGIAGYYTPVGRFAIGRKVPGYDPSPLGVLYKPMYFYGGYAIHGNPSVPPYPASHGCIRVPNFVADWLFESEPYGEVVIVY